MSAGRRSPGLRRATLPTAISALSICHRPVRSGLPSAVCGAAAVRFGLPSAVRGMPAVGRCNHCAESGVANIHKRITAVKIFIGVNTSRRQLLYSYCGLKKRIEESMVEKMFEPVNVAGKAALAAVSIATLTLPLVVGIINTPQMHAQSTQPLAFEVASIKENKGGDPRSIRVQY